MNLPRDGRFARQRVAARGETRGAEENWDLAADERPVPARLTIHVGGLHREVGRAAADLHGRLQLPLFEEIGERERHAGPEESAEHPAAGRQVRLTEAAE